MRRAYAALAVLALVACKDKEPAPAPAPGSGSASPPPSAADVLQGALRVGDERVPLVACKPGHAGHVFVDVVTAKGTLRFSQQKLSWDGAELACTKLDRSWGGGLRKDGSAYWRGTLAFTCTHAGAPLNGNLKLDCGGITADERASLDAGRADALERQRQGSGSGSAGPGSAN